MIYRSTIVLSLLIGAISPVAAQNNGITEPPPPPTTQQETFTSETPASDVLVRAYIPDDIQRLLPGDIIKFFVIEDEEPAQILRVKENGYVDFPYIGHVDVKGRTPKQVCDILKYELEKNYYYEATVFIGVEQSTRVRGTVQIMGAVDHPSEMQIPANTIFRLSNVMLRAGINKYTKLADIKVYRTTPEGEKTIKIDARPIFEEGSTKDDIILMDGDRIIVAKRGIIY